MRRMFQAALVIVWAVAAGTAAVPADEGRAEETEAVKAQRAERLVKMRELAGQFEMATSGGGDKKSFELRPDPIFRYSDQPRGFVDATLWAWGPRGATGRPAVIAKVEAAINETRIPYWQFCVASLADVPVTANLGSERRLNATKPGFELRPIPRAPEPADRPAARHRQLKDLVSRFTATIDGKNLDAKELVKQEMRLLTSPIHRYADELNGLRDGMIFGLTTNGTNPDMLIVIELHATTKSALEWKYGVVKMTDADVHVRLDRDEVWVSLMKEPRETWNYFHKVPREE
jgi:hypothetical protein